LGMPSRRTNNFPESGRGLGHVTPTILAVRSAILATAWLLVYSDLPQTTINKVINDLRKRLSPCVSADGGHFQHIL